jgi:hypothetical protein
MIDTAKRTFRICGKNTLRLMSEEEQDISRLK